MPETCRAEIEKNGMAKNILNKQEKASFSFIQLSFIMITFFWLRNLLLHVLCCFFFYLFMCENVQTSIKVKTLFIFQFEKKILSERIS